MLEKTEKQLIQELHQGLYGIPNTEEKGLCGDVKELVKEVRNQNTRIRKNEKKIAYIWGILVGLGAAGGTGIGLGIKALIGG